MQKGISNNIDSNFFSRNNKIFINEDLTHLIKILAYHSTKLEDQSYPLEIYKSWSFYIKMTEDGEQ